MVLIPSLTLAKPNSIFDQIQALSPFSGRCFSVPIIVSETTMAWARSKAFLERVQLGSIILYLVCLGGYTISAVGEVWDYLRADLFGFSFFSLFIASTILLRFERPAEAE
jgi:hypothetical protein